MKLTLSIVKDIKKGNDNKLIKRFCNYIISRMSDCDDKKHAFTDFLNYGLPSGIVGEFIYYSDTTNFYK